MTNKYTIYQALTKTGGATLGVTFHDKENYSLKIVDFKGGYQVSIEDLVQIPLQGEVINLRLDLNDLEKEYKKAVKQTGRSVYVKIRVNWRTTKCYTMPAGNAKYTDHQLIMAIISQAADTEMAKLDQAAFKVIRGMDYFAKA